MATRKTHKHQTFDPEGNVLEEVEEQEPLPEYHARELEERLQTIIDAAAAEITNIDNVIMPAVGDLEAQVNAATSVQDLKPILQTMTTGHRNAFERQRKLIVGIHALAKIMKGDLSELEI